MNILFIQKHTKNCISCILWKCVYIFGEDLYYLYLPWQMDQKILNLHSSQIKSNYIFFIIYYLLFIIYYLLFIIYYLLFIIYYLLFIIYYLLFIIYYLLFIIYYLLFIIYYLLFIIYYL